VARWKDGQIVEENLATTRRVDAPGPRAETPGRRDHTGDWAIADDCDLPEPRASAFLLGLSTSMTDHPMPAAFLGHGNPMNALDRNRYTEAWQTFRREHPAPSSRWSSNGS
jgi:hypothetical protein